MRAARFAGLRCDLNAVSILNDFTTAVILFGQFNILRSRALLLLASGYLFASLISVIQLLTFPGMFAAGAALLGAGRRPLCGSAYSGTAAFR